jgi:hypothetical protein
MTESELWYALEEGTKEVALRGKISPRTDDAYVVEIFAEQYRFLNLNGGKRLFSVTMQRQ